MLPNKILDHAWARIRSLADLATIEVLEAGPHGSIHVMVLSCEPILSLVTKRVELITPVALEVKPSRWGRRGGRGSAQVILAKVIRVRVGVQEGIPQRPTIGLIVEETPGQDVGVNAWGGIHGMGARSGVDDRLQVIND